MSVVLGSPDPDAIYAVGDTITLTVRVTANAGETANLAVGRLLYPSVLSPGIRTQTLLPPGGTTWAYGVLNCGGTPALPQSLYCLAFAQATGTPIAVNVTDFLLSTVTFSVVSDSLDHFQFSWFTSPFGPQLAQSFYFFGLTNAPGYSVTIIPEPATAALLGVGLLGLAIARRSRWARSTLLVALSLGMWAGSARAVPIEMSPSVVDLQWNGQPLGGTMQISLQSGDTDGTTTHLALHLEMTIYDWEPSGLFSFDVPVVSPLPGYSGGGVWIIDTYPNAFRWTFLGGGPPEGGSATIFVELAGVPTIGEFTVGNTASVSFTPIPEPASITFVLLGLVGLASHRLHLAQH